MTSTVFTKFLSCFLFMSAMLFFGSFATKAQSNSVGECKWVSLADGGFEYETYYNSITGTYDSQLVYKPKYKTVWLCTPTQNVNSSPSLPIKKTYPNTIRNANGTLRPGNGYCWVEPFEPDDFRVRLITGLIKTKSGKLTPDKEHKWVNPDDPNDFEVKPIGGGVNLLSIGDVTTPKKLP